MVTKEDAQRKKQIKSFFEIEWPLALKRIEILEAAREQRLNYNLLSSYRKAVRFDDDNMDMYCLLIEIDVKLTEILSILTEGKGNARPDLQTGGKDRCAHDAG